MKIIRNINGITVKATKTNEGIKAILSKEGRETLPFTVIDPFDLEREEMENLLRMTPQEMFRREMEFRNENPNFEDVYLFESKRLVGLARVKVKMDGEDGNIFAIFGRCRSALKEYGYREDAYNFYSVIKRNSNRNYEETLRYLSNWFEFC